MKSLRKLFVIAVGACLTLFTLVAHADFKQRLEEKFPTIAGSKVEKAFPGFWSVIKNGEVLFFSEDLTVMINGDVIDLANKQSLTARLKADNQPKIDISSLPLKDAIRLGAGARKIYVFSDPDCPYCKQLEGALNQLHNTEVFIFPMPLVSLHPKSRQVSESIWCQANQEKAWRAYMDTGVTPNTTTCDNPISRNLVLAEKLHIFGTPAIIFEDGTIFPGAIPVTTINDKLNGLASR